MESTFIRSANIRPFGGPDEEYHGNKDYISASSLKKIKVSPAHFREEEEEKESDALLFGSAYHCLILQPELFEKQYYIFDDAAVCGAIVAKGAADGKEIKNVRATKEYKTWREQEESFSDGKILIDKADYDKISAMKERLMKHPYVRILLSGGIKEQGYMGDLETESGRIGIKFKPDHVNTVKKFIVDLKTVDKNTMTKGASKEGFTKKAAELDYHIQAALYSDLMEIVSGDGRAYTFFFIAQEKRIPYAFNIFEASPRFIAQGRYEYEMLLQLYKYCKDNNYWPGYQVFCESRYGIVELKLPAWAIKDLTYYDHLPKKIIQSKLLANINN